MEFVAASIPPVALQEVFDEPAEHLSEFVSSVPAVAELIIGDTMFQVRLLYAAQNLGQGALGVGQETGKGLVGGLLKPLVHVGGD